MFMKFSVQDFDFLSPILMLLFSPFVAGLN